MFAPPCDDLHVLRSAREFRFGPEAWGRILSGIDLDAAVCLSDKPMGTVWRVTAELPDGPRELVMKVHLLKGPKDRVRSSLHLGRLRRQWRGAARLSRAGFRVAKCHALLRGTLEGMRVEMLVMESAPGRTLLDTIAAGGLSVREEHALADEVGRLVSRLSAERLHSKDLKPSNLLVGEDRTGAPTLTILDTDAVGHRPAHPLLPLAIEPTGLGVLPRKALRWRVAKSWAWHEWLSGPEDRARVKGPEGARRVESAIAREGWRSVETLVREHGDTRPVHNPIHDDVKTPMREGGPLARSAASG